MRRRLSNFAAVLALLTCLATLATWVLTFRQGYEVSWQHGPRRAAAYAEAGILALYWSDAGSPRRPREVRWGWTDLDVNGWSFGQHGWRWDGFGYEALPWPGGRSSRRLLFPLWVALLATSLVPSLVAARRYRSRRRRRLGRCPSCGYDVRATPERCPECGTDPREPPHNQPMQRTATAGSGAVQ